jgi:hypothetical protein
VDEPMEELKKDSISKVFTLKHEKEPKESGRMMNQLCWNSKGSLIAAA